MREPTCAALTCTCVSARDFSSPTATSAPLLLSSLERLRFKSLLIAAVLWKKVWFVHNNRQRRTNQQQTQHLSNAEKNDFVLFQRRQVAQARLDVVARADGYYFVRVVFSNYVSALATL